MPRPSLERLKRTAQLGDTLAREAYEREARRRGDHRAWLEALLLAPPTAQRWTHLIRCIDALLEVSPNALDLEAIEARLSPWPNALRIAPPHWWRQIEDGGEVAPWSLVRALDLSRMMLADSGTQRLAQRPELASLRILNISLNRIGEPGLEALSTSPHLAALTELDLSAGQTLERHHYLERITDRGAALLAASPTLTQLRVLKLRCNSVLSDGLAAIAHSATFAHLEHLDLAYQSAPGVRPFLHDAGFVQLAASPILRTLRHLDVAGNAMTAAALAALLDAPVANTLQTLELSWNRLGPQALTILSHAQRAHALSALYLHHTNLGDGALEGLRDWPPERALKILELDGNRITDAGLSSLLHSPVLQHLERLSLARNNLSGEPLPHLLERSPRLTDLHLGHNPLRLDAPWHATTLEQLDLSDCPQLNTEAFERWASGSSLPQLSHLALTRCDLGPPSLTTIWQSPLIHNLDTLILNGNDAHGQPEDADSSQSLLHALAHANVLHLEHLQMNACQWGPGCGAALEQATWLQRLKTLELANNDLGEPGLVGLLTHPLHTLQTLNLSGNALTAPTLARLTRSSMPALEALSLARNPLGPRGIQLLLDWDTLESIRHLDLSRCQLDHHAVYNLVSSPRCASLRELNLEANRLSSRALVALAESPFMRQLRTLRYHHNTLDDVAAAALARSPWLEQLDELEAHWGDITPEGQALLNAATTLPRSACSRLTRDD